MQNENLGVTVVQLSASLFNVIRFVFSLQIIQIIRQINLQIDEARFLFFKLNLLFLHFECCCVLGLVLHKYPVLNFNYSLKFNILALYKNLMFKA